MKEKWRWIMARIGWSKREGMGSYKAAYSRKLCMFLRRLLGGGGISGNFLKGTKLLQPGPLLARSLALS